MGTDARIYCTTARPRAPENCYWDPHSARYTAGVGLGRYYAVGYENDNWPGLAAVLLDLLADPNVETIWYHGDNVATAEPFTFDQFIALCRHYAGH